MKHYGDITKLSGYDLPVVDCITGGSPCQDLSVAGNRAGLSGERSGLFMEQIRIVKEMREHDKRNGRTGHNIRPRYMVWENVPGAFSSNKGADFQAVLTEIVRIEEPEAPDVPMPPKNKWPKAGWLYDDLGRWPIAWRVHDAQFWGVPQRRKRIALVADFGGLSAPEICFERKGLSWDNSESRSEGKETAGSFGEGAKDTGKCLNGWDVQSKRIQPENGIAESLYAGERRYGGGESYVMQGAISFQERAGKPGGGKGILIQEDRVGALSTLNNQSVLAAGDSHGTPHAVAEVYGMSSLNSNAMKSANPHSGIYKAETSRTLDLNGGNPDCNQGGMIVLEGNGSRPSHQGDGYAESDVSYTLNSAPKALSAFCLQGGGATSQNSQGSNINEDVSFTLNALDRHGVCTYQEVTGSLTPGAHPGSYNGQDAYNDMLVAASTIGSLCADDYKGINNQYVSQDKLQITGSVVRRLTPMECERLQGFPDGWTDIGEWIDTKGKKHKPADSPRYKALGNSIALPFWFWLLRRISAQYERPATLGSLFDGIGGFPLCWERCNGIGTAIWASEIEEFPIAVTKRHFPEVDDGQQ